MRQRRVEAEHLFIVVRDVNQWAAAAMLCRALTPRQPARNMKFKVYFKEKHI